MIYKGFHIIPNAYVSDTSMVKRTLKERLFTRPWKPFTKWKWIKDPKIYALYTGEVICSYETYSEIGKTQKYLPQIDQLINRMKENADA